MKETWKDIIGFEGKYQISNSGKVKSIIFQNHRLLIGNKDRAGYLRIKLWKGGVVSKTLSLHRLVAFHFVPNLYNKPEINHKNGIKADNRPSNLEWVTRGENQLHAYSTGLKMPAKSCRGGKYNSRSKPVLQIFEDGTVKKWEGIRHAAINLKLNPANICSVCQGKFEKSGGFKWRYAV